VEEWLARPYVGRALLLLSSVVPTFGNDTAIALVSLLLSQADRRLK
jgi:hypothetical protein